MSFIAFLALLSSVTARTAPPFSPRAPRTPFPPNTAAIAMAACEATNVTTMNGYLSGIETKINKKLAANTTSSKTTTKSHYTYDGHIPGAIPSSRCRYLRDPEPYPHWFHFSCLLQVSYKLTSIDALR